MCKRLIATICTNRSPRWKYQTGSHSGSHNADNGKVDDGKPNLSSAADKSPMVQDHYGARVKFHDNEDGARGVRRDFARGACGSDAWVEGWEARFSADPAIVAATRNATGACMYREQVGISSCAPISSTRSHGILKIQAAQSPHVPPNLRPCPWKIRVTPNMLCPTKAESILAFSAFFVLSHPQTETTPRPGNCFANGGVETMRTALGKAVLPRCRLAFSRA